MGEKAYSLSKATQCDEATLLHCKRDEESPSHLILHCPKYLHYRAQVFGSYTQDIIQTWTASQVARFLSEPSISEEGKCTDDSNL